MKKKIMATLLASCMALGICAGCADNLAPTDYFYNSGGDLVELDFARLKTGDITAEGFLHERLSSMADNIVYDMYELDNQLYTNELFMDGGTGSTSASYYLRSLAMTGYTLGRDDPVGAKLIARLETFMERIFAYAEQYKDDPVNSGLYVPPSAQNWINKQEVGVALQLMYECDGNEKALELLENYHEWLKKDLEQNAMAANWEGTRKVDVFDSAVWLYNNTQKEESKQTALDVMQLITEQNIDWEDIGVNNKYAWYNFYTRHIVNVTQGLKESVIFSQLTDSEESREAFVTSLNNLMRDHGRVDGTFNGSEQLSGKSSIEGIETCGVVEMVSSLSKAAQIIGDVTIADQLEKVGYNSLPAAFSTDMKSISYFNPSNLVQIVKGEGMGYTNLYYDGNPGYCTDADEDLGLGPHPACHCCNVNCGIGYPEFINSMYYATKDGNGVAVQLYGPSSAKVKVGKDAQEITIRQQTNYPYEDVVCISFETGDGSVSFPLTLRIPDWVSDISVQVNGEEVAATAGEYLTIDRKWSSSDEIVIDFNPEVVKLDAVNGSVGVQRGSLVFSVYIGERMEQRGTAGTASGNKVYYDYNVYPTNDWNYGLVLDEENFADNFEVIINARETNDDTFNYFDKANYTDPETAPIVLKVKAKQIDDWTLNDNNILAEEPPIGPVTSNAAEEEIYLIPYGTGKLKVSNIPVIATENNPAAQDAAAYSNDFSVNDLSDFIYYGPGYNITDRGFGTFYKIGYGYSGESSNYSNDDDNAWGHSAFNPKAILNDRLYSDFTLETSFTVRGTSVDNYGVIFRATDISHSRQGFRGYYAAIDNQSDELHLYKTVDFRPVLVASESIRGMINIVSGVKLKIECSGSNIKLYIGDELVIDVNDDEYARGQVGFVVHAFDFMTEKGDVASSAGKLDLAYAAQYLTVTPAN